MSFFLRKEDKDGEKRQGNALRGNHTGEKQSGFILYIQAESFEEAKKLAEAYVQDASLDTTDYPEIVQDMLEVAEYEITDVE